MTLNPAFNILIVDDNPTNLSVLSEALTNAGYQIAVATDGESALEQVEYYLPDLILLDVQMPGIDGFETCQRLKMQPLTQDLPIIFMTALADLENKIKGLSLGAVDYITKPFQQNEVLARVKTHLQLRDLAKALNTQNQLLKSEIDQRLQAEAALRQLNQELENRVESRTAELSQTLNYLQKTQLQLIQQEKLSTLGQLIAGVAHEINNPTSFILSNLTPAHEYITDIISILQLYQQHYPQPVPEITLESQAVDLDFAVVDLPKIIESMKLGIDRIKNISVSLRNFSRTDTVTKSPTDLHAGLDSTLLILQHRLKSCGDRPAIEIIKHYGKLPSVTCYPGQMNQVFMNILANAIDALEEGMERKTFQPQIQIYTEIPDAETVVIRIVDNGLGIAPEVQAQIFQPMFTTKCVGKGTGLGLSICHQIIVEQHGGKLSCVSTPGKGTEFAIEIKRS